MCLTVKSKYKLLNNVTAFATRDSQNSLHIHDRRL